VRFPLVGYSMPKRTCSNDSKSFLGNFPSIISLNSRWIKTLVPISSFSFLGQKGVRNESYTGVDLIVDLNNLALASTVSIAGQGHRSSLTGSMELTAITNTAYRWSVSSSNRDSTHLVVQTLLFASTAKPKLLF
jgi:hypothetical protein